MSFRLSRRSGWLAALLALLLLLSLSTIASPAQAASHQASASPHRAPDTQGTSNPVHTSTSIAPHKGKNIPASQPTQPAPVPVVSTQAAPSSGATVLNPPAHTAATSFAGKSASSPGISPESSAMPDTVTASPSFAGQPSSIDTSKGIYPNLSSDIGPYNVMAASYFNFSIYDRSGNLQYSNSFASWFHITPQGGGSGNVLFDPWNERFVLVTNNTTSLLITVAQQSNALGGYCNYSFATGINPPYRIGFQAVGVDETYLYVTTETDFLPGSTNLYQINLQQMESCSGVSSWSWMNVIDPNGQNARGLVPAMMYSYNPATELGTEYLVDASMGGGCSVTLWRINSHVLSNNTITTECYSAPPLAPDPGVPGTSLATTDGLFTMTQATYLNGLLDFALTTGYNWGGGNVTAGIAWLKINPVAGTVSQQGIIATSGYWYFFPAMAQDFYGKTVIVFEVSSPAFYPSVWYLGQNADGSQQNALALAWGTNPFSATILIGMYQSARFDNSESDHTATQIWISGAYAAGSNTVDMQIAQTAAS